MAALALEPNCSTRPRGRRGAVCYDSPCLLRRRLLTPDSPLPPRVVVVIPSRWASSRLPGKPLADIGGRPMIEHVYRRAAAARGIASVIVATDDERIAGAVARFGGACVMTRPDHPSGTDRIAEVAARPRPATSSSTSRATSRSSIRPMIEAAVAPLPADASAADGHARRASRPDGGSRRTRTWSRCVVDRHGFALYFSRAPVPYRREPGRAPARRGATGTSASTCTGATSC